MDQDSSNGAGADKRNWRERLGIGAKELPKLSDEFRDEPPPAPAPQAAPPAGAAKPAPRAPQPVAKPAPMAPRVASKPAEAAPPPAAPAVSRATPKAPDNATQDALAEKLRAQRAAAERLAEQRVAAARNRAETKPKVEPAKPVAPPPRASVAPTPARTPPAAPTGAARPKFSFADENRTEPPAPRPGLSGASAPLTPPRTSLGGERSPPPFLRPTAANGSLGARPQPTFRTPSEGSSSSGYISPPRLQAPSAPRPSLGSEAAGYGASRVPARRTPRPPPLDSYSRQPESRDYADDDHADDPRTPPRLGRPGSAPRGRVQQDDFDEVFEDEQAPRGRAGARDYQNAYNEVEDAFADEPRRSSGPWLLMAALLVGLLLTGGIIWYYSDSVRNLASGGSSSSSAPTPVIPAPVEPAKVAAPDTSTSDGQTETPARKKQIYDRIVGEQEVIGGGQMQPTEETPVQPDQGQPSGSAAPDQVQKIQPAAGSNAIPPPDAPSQGTSGQSGGLPEVDPPPPLPIPGSDQQGNLGLKGAGQQVAAASAQPELGSTAPPLPSPSSQSSSSDANPPPPPETATDGAALVSGGGSSAGAAKAGSASAIVVPDPTDTPDASPSSSSSGSASQPAAQQAAPAKKKPAQTAKTQPAKKPASSQPDYSNLGSAPVVLVPPSKQAMAQSQSTASAPATTAPVTSTEQPATQAGTQAANAQKRKSIFDLFNGTGTSTATTQTSPPTQVASAAQQTKQAAPPASTTKAPPPAQPQASAGSSGYVVQLASFRSQAEAQSEYSRIVKSYPSVVGSLRSQIRQTSVAGSTRYQLGLGPLPTRGDATRVCGELIAAGESDCIVRGP